MSNRPKTSKGGDKPPRQSAAPQAKPESSAPRKKPQSAAPKRKLVDIMPAAIPDVRPPASEEPPVDHGSLEAARTKWQYAEWSTLTNIRPQELEADPDRSKLALLVAAAHTHAGEMSEAKRLARLALRWGCSRSLVARVLLSSIHNSLGRVAASLEESAETDTHFEQAIKLVEPRADAALLAKTRRVRELARMGLMPDAAALLEREFGLMRQDPDLQAHKLEIVQTELRMLKQELALSLQRGQLYNPTNDPALADSGATRAVSKEVQAEPGPEVMSNPLFDRASYAYYRQDPSLRGRFLYLDVKSLPRSGLHYLRNSLGSIFGKNFSFCEWYNEPGCCRKMPCALTSFGPSAGDSESTVHVRMLKSHDFDLTDPAFPVGGVMRRIILVREPLYLLTSWWTLHALNVNGDLLAANGIKKAKIFYRHEREVLDKAYEIIDAKGSVPNTDVLLEWLRGKKEYIVGFLKKWSDVHKTDPILQDIACYDEVPILVRRIVSELDGARPTGLAQATIDTAERISGQFRRRGDPFSAPSVRISDYLRENSDAIRAIAADILHADGTNLLKRCMTTDTEGSSGSVMLSPR